MKSNCVGSSISARDDYGSTTIRFVRKRSRESTRRTIVRFNVDYSAVKLNVTKNSDIQESALPRCNMGVIHGETLNKSSKIVETCEITAVASGSINIPSHSAFFLIAI